MQFRYRAVPRRSIDYIPAVHVLSAATRRRKGTAKAVPLSGLYELLPAFGTGNRDLTLPLGHSHLLAAPGTIVIAVMLVF